MNNRLKSEIYESLSGSNYDRGAIEELQAECGNLKACIARLVCALIDSGIKLDVKELISGDYGIRYSMKDDNKEEEKDDL